ncbi:type VI secretion system tip protein VgrG, partial [Xenorhabdus bovienii]
MAKQAAGVLGGLGGAGTPRLPPIQGIAGSVASGGLGGASTPRLPVQGIAGPITSGGQGLVERAAGGQHAASKALQKASQLLGGGGGTAPSGLQFTLTAGGLPPETFVVTDFSLTEGFSQPF